MKPLQLPAPTPEQLQTLEQAYRTTRDARLRTRVQMILLALEHGWTARQIAAIVRESDETVRRWFKRDQADGVRGLHDAPRPGRPGKVTPLIESNWSKRCGAVRTASTNLIHCGPCNAWPIIWPSKPAFGSVSKPCGCNLRRPGLRLSRPQHTIASPDPEYLVKKDD